MLGETHTTSEPEQVLALSASETKASLLGVASESPELSLQGLTGRVPFRAGRAALTPDATATPNLLPILAQALRSPSSWMAQEALIPRTSRKPKTSSTT